MRTLQFTRIYAYFVAISLKSNVSVCETRLLTVVLKLTIADFAPNIIVNLNLSWYLAECVAIYAFKTNVRLFEKVDEQTWKEYGSMVCTVTSSFNRYKLPIHNDEKLALYIQTLHC